MHDRRGLVAALEVGQLLQNLGLVHAGQSVHAGALDGMPLVPWQLAQVAARLRAR
jgi:hypothetical protein